MLRLAVLTAALSLMLAGTAHAHGTTQWPADGRIATGAQQVALSYWRDRGLTTCPEGVTAYYARDLALDGNHALGLGGNCEAWVSWEYAGWYRELDVWSMRRRGAAIECNLWTHEFGHALGLALPQWDGAQWVDKHPDDGSVMDPNAIAVLEECAQWARKAIKRPRRGAAASRPNVRIAFGAMR